MAKFPQIGHFFNLYDSSLGRHVNATSRNSLKIEAYSFPLPTPHDQRPVHRLQNQEPLEAKICKKISFRLLLYIMKAKSQ